MPSASGAAFAPFPCVAGSASPPAAAAYYPFLGNWHGQGDLVEPGQAPVKLAVSFSCRKVSAGWAVACQMNANNKSMSISESDLMGVDPVAGKGHWYAVTNQGETHDHVTEWTDAKTMHAHYAWNQDGKPMQEDVTFDFSKNQAVTFRSVTSADGKPAGEFSGTLRH